MVFKNFNDDQFKNTGELKEYIEIEDYKLLISYDVYEYEVKEIKEGD